MDDSLGNRFKRKTGKNVKQYFREYCSKTSIHGIQYVGERNRNIFEKAWWMIIVVVSIALCSILVKKTYNNWKSRPVIVTLAEVPTPIHEVPFPAVTICPSSKVPQTIFNYTRFVEELKSDSFDISSENSEKLEAAALICEYVLRKDFVENSTVHWNLTNIFTQIGPLPETIFECYWKKSKVPCSDLFRPILTEEGLCYTFNMLDNSEIYTIENRQRQYFSNHIQTYSNWSLSEGYTTKNKSAILYPKRTLRSGIYDGLSIFLIDNVNDSDYYCSAIFPGHKVIFHDPSQVPRTSEQFVLVSKNHAVVAALKPNMIATSENLKNYRPDTRLCYHSTERPLRFFKVYTQKHCEMECLQVFILAVCECVPYFLPSDNTTPICGYVKHHCYTYPEEMPDLNKSRHKYDICVEKCLPACTSLTYSVESSLTEFNRQKLITLDEEFINYEASIITMFFKETEFIQLKRNELYGWTDFIANCGGLLGLFMGVSFLSVIEIVYFFTLRLWQNVRNQHVE